jgi:hypothetical protein
MVPARKLEKDPAGARFISRRASSIYVLLDVIFVPPYLAGVSFGPLIVFELASFVPATTVQMKAFIASWWLLWCAGGLFFARNFFDKFRISIIEISEQQAVFVHSILGRRSRAVYRPGDLKSISVSPSRSYGNFDVFGIGDSKVITLERFLSEEDAEMLCSRLRQMLS